MRSQVVTGDCEIRFEVGGKYPARRLSVVNHPSGTTTQIFWETSESSGAPLLTAATTGVGRRPLPGDVYGIRISRGHAEYLGPSGQVLARSGELPLEGAYRIVAEFGQLSGEAQELKRVTVKPAEPEVFVYTADMAAADGFTPGVDTYYVEVVRVSQNPSADDSDPLQITAVP
jgi:hypothetical protein